MNFTKLVNLDMNLRQAISQVRLLNHSPHKTISQVRLLHQSPPPPPRTFSGIQPTGPLHLGNYLGAVKRWVEDVNSDGDRNSNIFCVVDMHAITLPQPPDQLRSNIRSMTASLLACGLSPDNCILFQQSSVPEHAELCWVLATLCSFPRLAGLAQYKDKSARLKEVPLGLFIYPVLQAADILLYKASRVPVGEDNLQNLEIAQYLQHKFNRTFSPNTPYFPRPQAVLPDNTTARLRSLRDPSKKMSKSDLDTKACIYLTDSPDILAAKVKACVTDSTKELTYDPQNRPGVSNLIVIQAELSGESPEQVASHLQENNVTKVQLKEMVTASLVDKLGPIRTEMNRLLDDSGHIDQVLLSGGEGARDIAVSTVTDVKKMVGFSKLVK